MFFCALPDGPGASQGDQKGTDLTPEQHDGSIGEQTTARKRQR